MTTPPTFLQRVNQLVITRLNDPELLAVLNEHFELSTSQIYRKIKQKTGLSPSQYIRKIRLELAVDLIVQSDLTLTQIANQVGFKRLTYFSRCFSQEFGYTASSLRKEPKER